jgi:hypothetical protein
VVADVLGIADVPGGCGRPRGLRTSQVPQTPLRRRQPRTRRQIGRPAATSPRSPTTEVPDTKSSATTSRMASGMPQHIGPGRRSNSVASRGTCGAWAVRLARSPVKVTTPPTLRRGRRTLDLLRRARRDSRAEWVTRPGHHRQRSGAPRLTTPEPDGHHWVDLVAISGEVP